MSENRFSKYLAYASGEILLVVIGILIALQINNWNEGRIQQKELKELLGSIAGSMQSDIRSLDLLTTARSNSERGSDSLLAFVDSELTNKITVFEAGFIEGAFHEQVYTVHFQPNLNAFEALKNSVYLGKLQGTDLETLLTVYYNKVEVIQGTENKFNQVIDDLYLEWQNKFRDDKYSIFLYPYNASSAFGKQTNEYFRNYKTVLNDELTSSIMEQGFGEATIISQYEDLKVLGQKFIEMVDQNSFYFDDETKLEFSGLLFSYLDAETMSILINGKLPLNFSYQNVTFDLDNAFENFKLNDYRVDVDGKGYQVIEYPDSTFQWASPFFIINALEGRVSQMDFSNYSKIFIEMRGAEGGETFELAVKDIMDPTDGSEQRVTVTVTDSWKTYEFPLTDFPTADLSRINVPLAFLFEGDEGRTIHLRSVQFQ